MSYQRVDAGPGLVQRLLPQRPPLLMVDRIEAYALSPRPALRASRFLTANEPWFQGHFPDLPLLPGALLLEGLGQTASLLYTLEAILETYREAGDGLDELLADLRNLELGFTLRPGYRPEQGRLLKDAFSVVGGMPVGVAGSVRLKFLRPVPPGCQLVYQAALNRRHGDQLHFDVHAEVNDEEVARGTLAAAVVRGLELPSR
jgi:3-hydroxyacyl-[acyl-carrier-protein] dehydratase